MYKLYVAIAVLAIMGVIEFKKYHHILAATVIYPIMWILSFAGIILKGREYYEITWVMPCIVIVGYILFIWGFGLAYRNGAVKRKIYESTYIETVGEQILGLNIVTLVAGVIFVITLYYMLQVIDLNNILASLYKIKWMIDAGEKPFPYFLVVARYFFRCAIWYMSFVYFKIPRDSDYKDKNGKNIKTSVLIRLIAVSCMACVVMFTDISRNDILMTILPVLFIFLLAKKLSNIKVCLVSLGCFTAFVLIFIAFLYFRSGTLELFKEKGVEEGQDSFFFYLTCGTPAIDQMYRGGSIKILTIDGEGGKYTFSLIAALSDMIFSTTLKPEVLQKFINIGDKQFTNVYTYYHWLSMDFGLIYAAVFQFLYGLLYGYLYFKVRREDLMKTIWYAILMYPLCMMFFEDQYLAIGQTWLIIFAFLFFIRFVCMKTRVCIFLKNGHGMRNIYEHN